MPRWKRDKDIPVTLDFIYSRTEFVGNCRLWLGGCNKKGYGVLQVGKRIALVHRTVYNLHHGSIPDNTEVMHTCDNPPCVHLPHLIRGTHIDNMQDMALKHRHGSLTHPEAFARYGSSNNNSKLTEEQVVEIRRLRDVEGLSQHEIGRRFGVAHTTIGCIVNGKGWNHV